MAHPAARSAIAMTLLLLLLLLPVPAAAVVGPIRSPGTKKIGNIIIKKVKTAGVSALANALDSSTTGGQLGGDAADNAGAILYNVTFGKQTVSGTVDISNDFLWVQCPAAAPAKVSCASPACVSVLATTAEDCVDMTDCDYMYGSDSTGYIANEKITIGVGTEKPISGNVVFGCSTETNVKQDGAIGLSKGSLSILSQLNITRFSYFVTPDDSQSSSSTSVVLLGDQAVPQTKHSSSTPLIRSNTYQNLYYVKLTGIKVDGESLIGIPVGAFDFAADGNSGGVALSTTIPITWLQSTAYNAVRKALVSKIMSTPVSSSGTNLEGFDLCYNMKSVAELKFPKITLVFDGAESPVMDLTTVHYFYKNNVSGLQCLTMMSMPAEYTTAGSILGSMLQAGTNMIYDIGGSQLTFEKGAAAPLLSQVPIMAMVSMLLVWVLLL